MDLTKDIIKQNSRPSHAPFTQSQRTSSPRTWCRRGRVDRFGDMLPQNPLSEDPVANSNGLGSLAIFSVRLYFTLVGAFVSLSEVWPQIWL